MIGKLKRKLLNKYKVFRTTILLEDDLRLIRRINTQLNKHKKTGKVKYFQEVENIIRILHNLLHFDDELLECLLEVVSPEYKTDIKKLYNTIRGKIWQRKNLK